MISAHFHYSGASFVKFRNQFRRQFCHRVLSVLLISQAVFFSVLSAPSAIAAEAKTTIPAPPSTQSTPATASTSVLGTAGIGVKDLQISTDFYTNVLGMQVMRRFELGYITEVVMGFPGGSGATIVLMHWPNDTTRRYDGNDVKLVFYVDDPAAVIARIRARGGKIDREATPIDVLAGRVVGVGRDPDNYVVEVLRR